MIARLAFKIWGPEFHRMHAANEMRGDGREGLSFAFHGPDGHAYESWKDVAEIPPVRIKRVEEYLMWVDAKTTRTALEKVGNDIDAQLLVVVGTKDAAKRSAEAAKITLLYRELILRSTNVIPEEIYYQIAATCIVRDNENPRVLDEATHEAKARMLREAGRQGATFFTQVPPLKQLLRAWLTSEEGLNELLINWTMEREHQKTVRQALGFAKGSSSTEPTSTSSPSASQGTPLKATTS